MSGTAEQPGQALNPCAHDPYPGLRPYEENEQDQFFGRDADTQILLDKILTHRLTLLFAATGVGKSSLLKAAVIPKLKAASGKHLDVVYYNDWVTAPLAGLKAEIARTVQQSANWPPGTVLDESLSLVEFVQFCTLFVRPPLVIMLDQFEELFRYRNKYHKDTFKPFIEELTGLITATQIPVSIVFSMREDFALELNAFKPKLPTLLFENYYRLERLPAGAARQAIVEPLRPLRFAYEPELLEQLVQDLLKHDPDRDLSSLGTDDETETVIPPQLQIVCSQLWQKECGNPDRLLHLAVYEEAGRTEGLLKNYVEQALKAFNERDRRVLSRAFDHLVSIQGTKMPHTVATLAEKTGDSDKELTWVLEKLAGQDIRILRSQQREQKTWYELYHDMYSESINAWNRVQKRKMLWRQFKIWGSGVSGVVLVAYFGTVAYVHSVSHHLRLAPGDDNRVEIFRGKNGWPDLFGQKQFYSETSLLSREIEPDKRFIQRGILNYLKVNTDLIAYQPLEERITAYVYTGSYTKALDLYDKTIGSSGKQASAVVRGLFGLNTSRGSDKIKLQALSEKNAVVNRMALTLYKENSTSLPLNDLSGFRVYLQALKQGYISRNNELVENSPHLFNKLLSYLKHSDKTVRDQSAAALGRVGDVIALPHLVKALGDDNEDVRQNAVKALGRIGDAAVLPHLVKALGDDSEFVRPSAAEALGLIGDEMAFPHLVKALDDDDESVRLNAAEALGRIGGAVVVQHFVKVLGDGNKEGRRYASLALGLISDEVAVPHLINALGDDNESVRFSAAEALGRIGDAAAVPYLINVFGDDDIYVRRYAVEALGRIGDVAALPHLIKVFDDDNESVKFNAVLALGRIGDAKALPHLINALGDDNKSTRQYASLALGLTGDAVAVPDLINALSDDYQPVRVKAAEALGRIGDAAAVPHVVKALGGDSEGLREYAAEALGQIGGAEVVPHVVKALGDDDESVRLSAVLAFGRIGDVVVVPHLIKTLGDDDKSVRLYSAEALERVGYATRLKYERKTSDITHKTLVSRYDWYDYHATSTFWGRLQEVYGKVKDRQQLLAALNLLVPEARDLLLLQLAENNAAHYSIRKKAIEVLGEEGMNKPNLISALQTLTTESAILKRAVKTALKQLSKVQKPENSLTNNNNNDAATRSEVLRLKNQLSVLAKRYADWRHFRDSKILDDFPKAEDYDSFLEEVRNRKAEIGTSDTFDVAYALSGLDPKEGLKLLDHPIALVRQGAYTSFMMKANIETLEEIDKLREQNRDSPIFRHEAFRAIDLGLRRLEVLGNKNNDDKEYKDLMAWQQRLEANKARKAVHKNADDPDDEVLERLQWTTMMMAHTKKMTAKYAKDGWVRDWPENALPVNQPYPELNP